MLYDIESTIALIYFHLVLAWITGGLRCYTRLVYVKKFWWDDWLSMLSLVGRSLRLHSDHSADHILRSSSSPPTAPTTSATSTTASPAVTSPGSPTPNSSSPG